MDRAAPFPAISDYGGLTPSNIQRRTASNSEEVLHSNQDQSSRAAVREALVSDRISKIQAHEAVFGTYNPKNIQKALELLRDYPKFVDPILQLDSEQKSGIVWLLKYRHRELSALLAIAAEDEGLLEDFRNGNNNDTHDIFERLGERAEAEQDPVAPSRKRMRTSPLLPTGKPSRGSAIEIAESSTTLNHQKDISKSAGDDSCDDKYQCTYCGKTFKSYNKNLVNHEYQCHRFERKVIRCLYPGCDDQSATQKDFKVHHKIHATCELSTSCWQEITLPKKSASSCGYCGMLFEGESSFKERTDHITNEHHRPKLPQHCKTTKDWSRNLQLEAILRRKELSGLSDFERSQIPLHAKSRPCLKDAPFNKFRELIELAEGGDVTLGFSDVVKQRIFELAYKLGATSSSEPASSHDSECLEDDGIESLQHDPNQATGNQDPLAEHIEPSLDRHDGLGGTQSINLTLGLPIGLSLHAWEFHSDENRCLACDEPGWTFYRCQSCKVDACERCSHRNEWCVFG